MSGSPRRIVSRSALIPQTAFLNGQFGTKSRSGGPFGRPRRLLGPVTDFNERTGNVYENKGRGQKVEKSRSRGVEESSGGNPDQTQSLSRTPGLGGWLLNSSTLRLQNSTNDPGMSMKTKDRCGKLGCGTTTQSPEHQICLSADGAGHNSPPFPIAGASNATMSSPAPPCTATSDAIPRLEEPRRLRNVAPGAAWCDARWLYRLPVGRTDLPLQNAPRHRLAKELHSIQGF
jgi:hypothetical protein